MLGVWNQGGTACWVVNIFKSDSMTSLIDFCVEIVERLWGANLDEYIELFFVKLRYILGGLTSILRDHNIEGNYMKEDSSN